MSASTCRMTGGESSATDESSPAASTIPEVFNLQQAAWEGLMQLSQLFGGADSLAANGVIWAAVRYDCDTLKPSTMSLNGYAITCHHVACRSEAGLKARSSIPCHPIKFFAYKNEGRITRREFSLIRCSRLLCNHNLTMLNANINIRANCIQGPL